VFVCGYDFFAPSLQSSQPAWENREVSFRILAAFVFASLLGVSQTQTLTVKQLAEFLKSSAEFIQKRQATDAQVAGYLAKVKMRERLSDAIIEDIQSQTELGPRTMAALKALRDRSQELASVGRLEPPPKPTPIPPPSAEEQAAIMSEVRDYALNYSGTLPDFICTEVQRRMIAPLPGTRNGGPPGSDPHWYAQDTLQIRLSYFNQREQYLVVLANNAVVNKDYSKMGGSKSFGEFGSMLKEIFEPSTETFFEWDHWGTLRGKRVMAFRYQVRQDRSKFAITVEGNEAHVIAAYHGLVEIDPSSHVILRVTTEADSLPPSFPVRKAADVLDYDYTELAGRQFLLPLKAQILMTASDSLQRLDEEFRIYRKYSADSDITFDTQPIAPLSDDKTKESKDAGAGPAKKP
jgi:hypothetical protein